METASYRMDPSVCIQTDTKTHPTTTISCTIYIKSTIALTGRYPIFHRPHQTLNNNQLKLLRVTSCVLRPSIKAVRFLYLCRVLFFLRMASQSPSKCCFQVGFVFAASLHIVAGIPRSRHSIIKLPNKASPDFSSNSAWYRASQYSSEAFSNS